MNLPLVENTSAAPVSPSPAPLVLASPSPAKVSEVYESYWRFAAERQEIFFRRVRGEPRPWTNDTVLATYKFTNAYRASDRVSQYLIRHVIYRSDLPNSPDEVFFRILLFKLFNKIETWELLENAFGSITFEDYRFPHYDSLLSEAMASRHRIYSAAYIMPPGSRAFGQSAKHQNHLLLLEYMMRDRVGDRLAHARTMQEGFEILQTYPTIGDFLAYQFITDVNYSEITDFSEMDFVVPGPGARDGLRKCFSDTGGLNEPELIRLIADIQEQEFERRDIKFRLLWGRRLQLIDCQNLFCEVDKYARVAHPHVLGRTGRIRIKQKYEPKSAPIALFYPPKWKLNEKIHADDPPNPTTKSNRGMIEIRSRKKISMDFQSYQEKALQTDRTQATSGSGDVSLLVPLLGLAGEAGELLSEYKKHLRDGEAHQLFTDRVSEELGDLLWYISNIASKFNLRLDEIATSNLSKTRSRWHTGRTSPLYFDTDLPDSERLPRQLEIRLAKTADGDNQRVRIWVNGELAGNELTDNAYYQDGYRFHDVFHFTYAAVLGWSPVIRALLGLKRKSDRLIDEVEDGGRAIAIEEGVAAYVFSYAKRHNMLDGVSALDSELLRTIQDMTSHLEVSQCTTGDWEQAILQGFRVWRVVLERQGGVIAADLDQRRIEYVRPLSADQMPSEPQS